jgi:hypothetical protein
MQGDAVDAAGQHRRVLHLPPTLVARDPLNISRIDKLQPKAGSCPAIAAQGTGIQAGQLQ